MTIGQSGFVCQQVTISLSGNSIRRTLDGRVSIQASGPIMVAKFVTSDVAADAGHPSMTIVQPTEQFISSYEFQVHEHESTIGRSFVMLKVPVLV